MKLFILKQKKSSLKIFFFSFIAFFFNTVNAQVQDNGLVHIFNGGSVNLLSGTYSFGGGTTTTSTSRTSLLYGKMIFTEGVLTSGASNSHFLDGYGSYSGTTAFVFPVGQSSVYAPVKVIPSTSTPIDAAYYFLNPTLLGSTLDPTVVSISNQGYWHIAGSNSCQVSLTWSQSNMTSGFVDVIDNLIIVGFNGTKWVKLPSTVDITSLFNTTSNLVQGSITTTSNVDLSTYKYFTIGTKIGDPCSTIIASGLTKTWNGTSWVGGTPTLADSAIISAPYSGGTFSCKDLTLNNDVTLINGQYIEIVNEVTGTGKIIMTSEASVVQRNSISSAPNIELTKKTRSMRRFDYVYWGTPITGNFFTQLAAAKASTSPSIGAFDSMYKYVSGSGGGWQTLTAIETGKGFITRIKQQAPFTDAATTDYINLKFTGLANNGDITVPITNNIAAPNGGTSHVLLANPYPSAIDADKFLVGNAGVDGVVYIWTSATGNTGPGSVYSQADYIAYTRAGAVIPNSLATTFDGKIASGQGFEIKSLTNSGNVTFTNCMRLTSNNTNFYRTTTLQVDRFKLNMTGANGVFSQILVAYLPEATLGYDRMYDAGRNSVSTAQLYSVFEGDGRKLAINARPAFVATDIVPVGISKQGTTTEDFTITISDKEGVFNTANGNVYLHDKLNATYHNFSNGAFNFSSNSTLLNTRFEIVYSTSMLNSPTYNLQNATASVNKSIFNVKATIGILDIQIYDINGRLIEEFKVNGENNITRPFNFSEGFYIAKITLADDTIVSQKLIHK
jgi:hypothetical protein